MPDGRPVHGRAQLRLARLLARGVFAFAIAATVLAAAPNPTGFTADGAFDLTALVPEAAPTLRFEDSLPVITGSVTHLFTDATFSGPNRSERQDRLRPEIDIAEFTEGFAPLYQQVAEQRRAEQEAIMVAAAHARTEDQVVTIAYADASAPGLAAIDALANPGFDPDIPRPAAVPETLAFGRATEPATDFTPRHDWSEREQWCLATGIYFEARGESYRGQVAVAQVIMNRVDDYRYPDTICGVVYQNQHRRNACQFSFACDGIPDRVTEPAAWSLAEQITREVLNREIYLAEVADSTHYHATYVNPHWARNMDRQAQIGLHIFYRFRPGWQFG